MNTFRLTGIGLLIVAFAAMEVASSAARGDQKEMAAAAYTNPAPYRLGVHAEYIGRGALITSILKDSPAAKAGFDRCDRILRIDGFEVGCIDGVLFPIQSELRRAKGGKVSIEYVQYRTGKTIVVEVVLK
jgi:C-terminal processing protease CtpA/Prc